MGLMVQGYVGWGIGADGGGRDLEVFVLSDALRGEDVDVKEGHHFAQLVHACIDALHQGLGFRVLG